MLKLKWMILLPALLLSFAAAAQPQMAEIAAHLQSERDFHVSEPEGGFICRTSAFPCIMTAPTPRTRP